MTGPSNLSDLPPDLPVPEDDGACDHLPGLRLPGIGLLSTSGEVVDLSALEGRAVVYCYPMTGRPEKALPEGWDSIPGARGCTPQSCAFRDHHAELASFGVRVFGLSTQDTEYQREAARRLHLPFGLLSDPELEFATALGLPTFEAGGGAFIKRLTLILGGGRIEKVFYPVFPSDADAGRVIGWLRRAGERTERMPR